MNVDDITRVKPSLQIYMLQNISLFILCFERNKGTFKRPITQYYFLKLRTDSTLIGKPLVNLNDSPLLLLLLLLHTEVFIVTQVRYSKEENYENNIRP